VTVRLSEKVKKIEAKKEPLVDLSIIEKKLDMLLDKSDIENLKSSIDALKQREPTKTLSYRFDIARDDKGLLDRVVARPIEEN